MGKASDKSPKTYRLKPVSWKEARPYEWSGLSESERKSIARAATVAFQNLNIPESDPIWNHVRYRSPTSLNPSTSSDRSKSSASNPAEDRIKKEVVAKRGISSSRDTKDKKPKPKADSKAEIMMKDESKPTRAPPPEVRNDPPRANPAERRANEHTRTASLDNRRNDPAPTRRAPENPDRRPPAPELKLSKSSSRHDEPSPAASSSKPQRQAERSAAPSVSAPKIAEEKTLSSQRIKKIRREGALGGASDSEKERDRPHTQAERAKAKEKMGRRDMDDSPRDEARSASAAAKRKAATDYDNDDFQDTKVQKRRKTEPVLPLAQREREREREKERDRDTRKDRDRERERERDRDIPKERERERAREDKAKDSTPIHKKSQNESRTQTKPAPRASTSAAASSKARHDSPSPALKHNLSNNARGGYSPASAVSSNLNPSNASHKSGSAKPRRRSPIYTSSEEEEEEEVPLKTTARRPAATKIKPSVPAPAPSSKASRDREPSSKNLPTDHAALRARYNTSYLEYLTSLQRLMVQKGKLDTMLKSNDLGSSGSITDSEGDIELMDAEELAQLTSTHKKLREELQSIQVAFERTTKNGEPLPPAPELLAV
jgi:RNA polymerase II elongation factor ELL